MEKKPVNFVVKSANEAAKELNAIVEKGGSHFDIGISEEYINHVTKNSDGTTTNEKEKVFRVIGFVDMMIGSELDSLNAVKEEMKMVKEERKELNRTLNIMNKSAFAPISILLFAIAIITLSLGILTLAGVLPLPPEQLPIAIVLTILGSLALAGSIVLFVFRRKKKLALLAEKDEINNQDAKLKEREANVESRTPRWYKDAIWRVEGNTIINSCNRLTLKK